MQTVRILNNAPITVNGCKCVIKAELVTLRSLVIDVYVSKRRGQLVKSNWQNVWGYLRIVFKPNEEEYTMYIPLSCFYEEDKFNRELDKDSIEVYVLSKEGEMDIYRVK